MREMILNTPDDLATLAKEVLVEVSLQHIPKERATILGLYGELGAGKTAFTQALAKTLGVVAQVTSPTFVILRRYEITTQAFFKQLVHIDAYRIESLHEIAVIGFSDLVCEPTNLMCVEWADRLTDALPKDAYHIYFTQPHGRETDNARKVLYGYETLDEARTNGRPRLSHEEIIT